MEVFRGRFFVFGRWGSHGEYRSWSVNALQYCVEYYLYTKEPYRLGLVVDVELPCSRMWR
jgi:hypothetical protein